LIAAVLDTDAILSGIGWPRSPSRRLVQAIASGRVVPVTCPAMLEELEATLSRRELAKIFPDPAGVFALVESISFVVDPVKPIAAVERPHGNRMLEAAKAAAADYIVTSDIELLRLGEFSSAKIVRPHPV